MLGWVTRRKHSFTTPGFSGVKLDRHPHRSNEESKIQDEWFGKAGNSTAKGWLQFLRLPKRPENVVLAQMSFDQSSTSKLGIIPKPFPKPFPKSSKIRVHHVRTNRYMIKSTLKIARYCPIGDSGFLQFLGLFQVIMWQTPEN